MLSWADFKAAVREILSDGARTDDSYCYAISLWVLSELARQVDHDLQEYGSYRGQYARHALKLLDYTPTLTSEQIGAQVRELLVAHGPRRNVQVYIDRLITQARQDQAAIGTRFNALLLEAVADIQHYIPAAQLTHTTTYVEDDVAQEGDASHACMPDGAMAKQMWLVDKREDVDGELIRFTQVPWPHRYHQMINRSAVHLAEDDLGNNPLVAIEYGGREFYIWPALVENAYELRIEWTGKKAEFLDGDSTPFDRRMAEAAAKYISAKLPAVLPSSGSQAVDLSDYRSHLRKLFVESGDRSRVAN